MKKLISKLLVCALVISLVSVNFMTYASMTSYNDEYSSFKTQFSQLNSKDVTSLISVLTALAEDPKSTGYNAHNLYGVEITNALTNLASKAGGSDAKLNLINNGLISDSDYKGLEAIITGINDIIFNNYTGGEPLQTIFNNMKEGASSESAKKLAKINIINAYKHLYSKLPPAFILNHDYSKFGDDNSKKAETLLGLVKAMFTKGDKLVNINDGVVSFVIPNDYIAKANVYIYEETNTQNFFKEKDKAIAEVILDVMAQKINAKNKVDNVRTIASKMGILQETTTPVNPPIVNPGNGGSHSSGGGGGGSSSTPSITPSTPSVDKKAEKIEATVSKDAATIKTEGKTTVAEIKKEELTKAVQSIMDKLTSSNEAVVKIDLSNIKDLNVKVSLPVESLKKLEGKEGSIVIVTDKLEVNIPIKDLDLGNVNASISLDVKELSKDDVKNMSLSNVKEVAKVIDISLLKVDGNNITKIDSNFTKKVSVGIDVSDVNINKDKAVVVLVKDDGTSTIVGAKVKGSKIFANLAHFSKYAVVERNIAFNDTDSHWSKANVESMAAKNIVNGYEDNTFKPENKVTRAEFAKLLAQALELDVVKSGSNFSDMDSNWANDYVNAAYKAGLVKGVDNKFNPNANITRAEMATMIGRGLKDVKVSTISFNDSNLIPSWATDALNKAVKEDLIKGDNGSFRPSDNTTRAEAASVIYRLFNK